MVSEQIHQLPLIQQNGCNGKGTDVNHAADCQWFADQNIHHNGQRHIDDHAHVADVDAENVLDHGTDTIESGGGKTIREDKKFVVQRTNQSDQNDDSIGQKLFYRGHFCSPDLLCFILFFAICKPFS